MNIKTIPSDLFNKNNESNIPEWMQDIPTDFKKSKKLNLEFDKLASWEEKPIVVRDERDYTPKEVTAKLNNNAILNAKIELSKFLSNKHYSIIAEKVQDNLVTLNTNLSNVPGEFEFLFDIENDKVKLAKSFKHNEELYPMSKAGLEESIIDSKQTKTAQKVVANKMSLISREEIFRRYNGHIRQATDRINELLKSKDIVGVASNAYGTYLDTDYLFPQQDKEIVETSSPFEFVDNLEKVATTENKSAYQLAMEASKQFENNFDDFNIKDFKRIGNKLQITAEVLKDNITYTNNFFFDIKNEKLKEKDFTSSFKAMKPITAKKDRISKRNVISKSYIKSYLRSQGYFDSEIDTNLSKLANDGYIVPISDDQYVSEDSLEEVLQNIQSNDGLGKQDLDKYYELSDRVQDLRTQREDIEDTGIRDAEDKVSVQTILANANIFLMDHFDEYTIDEYEVEINDNNENSISIALTVFDKDSGLDISIVLYLYCLGNKVTKYQAYFLDQEVDLNDLSNLYDKSETLNNYLEITSKNHKKSNIQFTKQRFFDIMNKVAKVDKKSIDKTLELLKKNNKIQEIGLNRYASNYSLERLINMSNLKALTKDELKSLNIKSQHSKEKKFISAEVLDTGVRELETTWTNKDLVLYFKKVLDTIFKQFKIEKVLRSKDSYKVITRAMDEDGLLKDIMVIFENKNNTPGNVINIIKQQTSKAVQEYLTHYDPNLYNSQGIFTQKQLIENLREVVDKPEEVIPLLVIDEYLEVLADNKYKVKTSMSNVVQHLEKCGKINLTANKKRRKEATRIAKPTDSITVMDNDTRELNNVMTEEEREIFIKDKIDTFFKDFKIKAIIDNDDEFLVAIDAIDNDGIEKNVEIYFNTDKFNNPQNIIRILKSNTPEEVSEFLKYNKANIHSKKGIISKLDLKNKLEPIINIKNYNNICANLLKNNYISEIDSQTYTLNNTLSDIVSYLHTSQNTDMKSFKDRIAKATSDESLVKSTPIKETDTRSLERERELTSSGKKSQKNILLNLKNMYHDQKLTLKKYKEFSNSIKLAKSERELQDTLKEINKYN